MGIMDREYYNNNNKADTRNKFNSAEASRNEEKSLLVTGGITAVAAVGAVALGAYLIKKLCD